MAYAFVQAGTPTKNTAANGSFQVTVSITGVASGSLLYLPIAWTSDAATISSVNDGTAWSVACTKESSGGGGYSLGSFYLKNAGSGTHTITVTFGGAATMLVGVALEYSNIDTTAPFDQMASPGSAGNVTTTVATTPATTSANELVIGSGLGDTVADAISDATGYTDRVSYTDVGTYFLTGDKRVTSTGAAQSVTINAASNSHLLAMIATFIEAAAGSGDSTIPFLGDANHVRDPRSKRAVFIF